MSDFIVSDNASFEPKTLLPITDDGYDARCVGIYALGMVTEYNNFKKKDVTEPKIIFEFELIGHTTEYKGVKEPKLLRTWDMNAKITTKPSPSKLFSFFKQWRGRAFTEEELKGFDIRKVLGAPASIMITHSKDGKYENIETVNRGHKDIGPATRELRLLGPTEENWSWEIYESLPDFIKDKIKATPQFKAREATRPAGATPAADMGSDEDEVPF
jgi:hypothetical protein